MPLLRKILLISLLLCTPVFAADPPNLVVYPPQKIMGFRGLDTRSTAPTLADGRAIDLQNVSLSAALDIRKRYGYSIINESLDDLDIDSPAVTGIFDAHYSNGTQRIYAFVGKKLKYDNDTIWTTVNTSPWTDITTGQNNQWKCIMALDSAVCTNDVDVPIKISYVPAKTSLDFTGLTYAVTKAKDFVWFRNYLIALNTYENSVEYPSRFRWSDVGYIETWDDDNYVDIATFAGDEIIGSTELSGDLYIFLTKSIWKASLVGGNDVFVFKKVIDGIGAIARDSIQTVQLPNQSSAVMFLSRLKKVYLFDGSTVADAGAYIQDTLDNLVASRLKYAVSTFDGEHYYLSVSDGSSTYNDLLLVFNTYIGEWTKHTQIDANALAQVEETTSTMKTYFGNYNAFVYWLNDPDLVNDVDGATGIVEEVGVTDLGTTITGAQVIIDTSLPDGDYAGAIIRITGGTAAGQERVIISDLTTGVVVASAFSTTPDTTSIYSIGDINAYFETKWYDLGDSNTEKNFLGMLFWAEESSNNEVDVSHYTDFESQIGSETISLAPASSSVWDTALWDDATWAATGDKLYTSHSTGLGNFIKYKFSNDEIDETFHIFGFSMLGQTIGTRQ